jgi:CBS domain containing-hemolysin-like protein
MLAPPLVGIARVFRPIVVALNSTSNGIVRLFGVRPVNEAVSTFTLDEVATIVHQSTREGVLTDRTGTLSNAFEFSAKKVQDVTLGLDTLVCLPQTATPADVERAVAKHGFSRYVIVDASGDPVGYIHLKDVLDLEHDGYESPVPSGRFRPFVTLRPETDIEDALAMMRRAAGHVGRTVGPEGQTLGVVFLEDIIEELVGEVQDATRRA